MNNIYTTPENITELNADTFLCDDATTLEVVNITKNIIWIDHTIFDKCTNLKSIIVDTENKFYSDIEGVLFDNTHSIIIKYPPSNPVLNYNMPDSVFIIKDNAFINSNIESINLSANVSVIPAYSFTNCNKLKSISFPSSVTLIENNAFENCSALQSIILGENVADICKEAFKNCISLLSITFNKRLEAIRSNAFLGCINLTLSDLPKGLTELEAKAFEECSSLSDIVKKNINALTEKSKTKRLSRWLSRYFEIRGKSVEPDNPITGKSSVSSIYRITKNKNIYRHGYMDDGCGLKAGWQLWQLGSSPTECIGK